MPKSIRNIMPDTTGEKENGRSIRVTRRVFPRNWNLVIAQEAAYAEIRRNSPHDPVLSPHEMTSSGRAPLLFWGCDT